MTHEGVVQSENSPRGKTLQLIRLLERLPLQRGKSVTDLFNNTPGTDRRLTQERALNLVDTVKTFDSQRQKQEEDRNRGEFKSAYMAKYNTIMAQAQVTGACKDFLSISINQ